MENEIYWEIVFYCSFTFATGVTGYCLYHLVKPFLLNKKYAWCIGAVYFVVMFVLYFEPYELSNFSAYSMGVFAAFAVMCILDKRNINQKIYLAVTFFLLRWISMGLSNNIAGRVTEAVIMMPALANADLSIQYLSYIGNTIFLSIVRFLLIWLAVRLILRAYVHRRENMTGKELILFLLPSFSIIVGYFVFQFYEKLYQDDTGKNLVDVNGTYGWLLCLYQVISFMAILVMIIVFQNIKDRQRQEKQGELLTEQVESIKGHIGEVERLYRDIRSLKHDIGNHVVILENLYQKKEYDEAFAYVTQLKSQFDEMVPEIKSGNPVTDVILTEKRQEAEEKGIVFECEFYYPQGAKINAFDVSVILSNAISNAIEGTAGEENPFVRIISYRRNNAYIIEVKNSFSGEVLLDGEDGLPETTKKDKKGHGFGLANIRRIAQKYFGDIAIEQDGKNFTLSIMLMLEQGEMLQ